MSCRCLLASMVLVCAATPAFAQDRLIVPDPCDLPTLRSAGWKVARTLLFKGHGKKVQVFSDGAIFLWRALQPAQKPMRLVESPDDGTLIGVKPRSLSGGVVVQKPTAAALETAALQRTFRKLTELGLHEEAAEVARRLTEPALEDSAVVNAVAKDVEPARIQQTSLRPNDQREWRSAARTPITCRFEGESIEEAVQFFARRMGVSVRVEAGGVKPPRIHFACTGLEAEQALLRIVASCGWTMERDGAGVVVRPLALLHLRANRLPVLR